MQHINNHVTDVNKYFLKKIENEVKYERRLTNWKFLCWENS